MGILEAIVLGVVEGITEYLPVSSTGHLILTQRLLGIPEDEAANAYAITIQAGAILAVLKIYWPRVRKMIEGLLGSDESGRRLAQCVMVAFLPAAVVGLAFDDMVEQFLFGLWPIAVAWLIGGLVILGMRLYPERPGQALEEITPKAAFLIGLFQCLALWPGTSRSLVTILGGVVVGLTLAAAVEFSFLLGLITLGAATAYMALKSGSVMVASYGVSTLVVGFLASGISAFVAVKWMVDWINRKGMAVFGYWRVGLGLTIIALLLLGHLSS